MEKINFKNLNESIFHEKLDNGINVYFYPTKKSKNFYMTISVKYGAKVIKYKKGNEKKYNEIIPGSAHFLEHKIMDNGSHEEEFEIINNLGSFANAYTNYNGTNYNMFGSEDIIKNLEILLNLVLNPKITEKNVTNEKSIISEEIDTYKDDIISFMNEHIKQNLFFNAYPIHNVLGEKSDIKKITSESLKKIYKDFYNLNNIFIVITGNFNKEEVIDFLNEYMKKIPKPIKFNIKIKHEHKHEPDTVKVTYEEIKKDMEGTKVLYGVKIPKNKILKMNGIKKHYYLYILMASRFSVSAPLYEKYKNENLIVSLNYSVIDFEKHIVLLIDALTNNPSEFIKNLKEDIKNFQINEETFNRKQKVLISNLIMTFEDIEDIENLITTQIFRHDKVINNIYNIVKSLNFKEIKDIEKNIDFNNSTILRTIK